MVSPVVTVASKKQPEEPNMASAGKPRAVYRCKQCGLPAKGHDCAFRYPQQQQQQQRQQQQQGSSNMKSKPKSKSKTTKTKPKPHQELLVRRQEREREQQEQEQQQQLESSTRTSRKMERGDDNDNDDDDDESSFSMSSTETDERKASGRPSAQAHQQHQQTSHNQKQNHKRQKQNAAISTEVLMALHIFQDEVHAHRQEHDVFHTTTTTMSEQLSDQTDTDARFLTVWSRLAVQQFTHQNLLVAQNLELVQRRRQLGKRVQTERNTTVAIRSKIRRVQAESIQVEQELAAIRQQKSTFRAASRFLIAVERCQK